jgi:hypothetical protein
MPLIKTLILSILDFLLDGIEKAIIGIKTLDKIKVFNFAVSVTVLLFDYEKILPNFFYHGFSQEMLLSGTFIVNFFKIR